ncbi:MAG TPA: hypothetical protein VH539_15030 [Gemmatimonadaceae bacterium]|jgi:hypothetical protein
MRVTVFAIDADTGAETLRAADTDLMDLFAADDDGEISDDTLAAYVRAESELRKAGRVWLGSSPGDLLYVVPVRR